VPPVARADEPALPVDHAAPGDRDVADAGRADQRGLRIMVSVRRSQDLGTCGEVEPHAVADRARCTDIDDLAFGRRGIGRFLRLGNRRNRTGRRVERHLLQRHASVADLAVTNLAEPVVPPRPDVPVAVPRQRVVHAGHHCDDAAERRQNNRPSARTGVDGQIDGLARGGVRPAQPHRRRGVVVARVRAERQPREQARERLVGLGLRRIGERRLRLDVSGVARKASEARAGRRAGADFECGPLERVDHLSKSSCGGIRATFDPLKCHSPHQPSDPRSTWSRSGWPSYRAPSRRMKSRCVFNTTGSPMSGIGKGLLPL